MRKIPFKNYVLYFMLCIFTFLLLFLFVNKVKRMDKMQTSVLSGFLYEIKQEDFILNLKSYALDNPSFILYISNHRNSTFDLEFKQYVIENELIDNIIYFDGWNQLNNNFVKVFRSEFFSSNMDINLMGLKQTNLYTYQEGNIVNVLYKNKQEIDMNDVKLYLESYGDANYD